MMDWILTPARVGGALGLLVGYVGLCASVAWQQRRQRQAQQQARGQWLLPASAAQAGTPVEAAAHAPVLVVYASQTGQAEALAMDTARALHTGGCAVQLLPVQAVTQLQLRASRYSLWVLSTTGEGDAPDQALPFVQTLLAQTVDLPGHTSHVLALGDRSYAQYCAFGQRVHAWLQAQGAQAQLLCVDGSDAAAQARALQQWQSQTVGLAQALNHGAGGGAEAEARPADHEGLVGFGAAPLWPSQRPASPWVLRRRTHLNPGSQGGAVYLLEWEPPGSAMHEGRTELAEQGSAHTAVHDGTAQWESGDLVSLCPPSEPDAPRDYTIASIPQDGSLHLLVRQSQRADGAPGVASHWLGEGMALGDALPLRIRAHSAFRMAGNGQRPVIFIGNGTGLAGLVSHIKARVQQHQWDHWLLLGERSPQYDHLLDAQLQQWLAQGQLARLDRAWSRDVPEPLYVQQLLAQHADSVREWVARGAAIYVCGSRLGMAQGVHEVLRSILGGTQLEALTASGRYRRDVY